MQAAAEGLELVRSSSVAGYKGVCLHRGKYQAEIWEPSARERRHLGTYSTPEEAALAVARRVRTVVDGWLMPECPPARARPCGAVTTTAAREHALGKWRELLGALSQQLLPASSSSEGASSSGTPVASSQSRRTKRARAEDGDLRLPVEPARLVDVVEYGALFCTLVDIQVVPSRSSGHVGAQGVVRDASFVMPERGGPRSNSKPKASLSHV